MEAVKARAYRSPLREEQAQATKQRLAANARALFTEKGYLATTVAEIARGAGVSVPTVYAVFEGKKGLIRYLLAQDIFGLAAPDAERPDPERIRAARTGRDKLAELAVSACRIGQRGSATWRIVLGASGDPEVAEILTQVDAGRLETMAGLADHFVEAGVLRTGLRTGWVRDILYWATSPQTYLQLVNDRGWTGADFQTWLNDALVAMLLPAGS